MKTGDESNISSLEYHQRALASQIGSNSSIVLNAPSKASELAKFPADFPSEKRIPGTNFIVDGFRVAGAWSVSYFLSHFHSDHYMGLTQQWNKGIIFCSEITGRLLLISLKISEAFIVQLPIGEVVEIDGCKVSLVDANHCPGAVQMLFEVRSGDGTINRYIHTGDMRFSPSMKVDSLLCDFVGADAIFLDTTYCNPKFVFPTQDESVLYIVQCIEKLLQDQSTDLLHESNVETKPLQSGETELHHFKSTEQRSSILILISTYIVGKEKILTAVAKHCKCLLYVDERKLELLKCLNLEDIDMFTTNPAATCVHVIGWNFLGETWPFFRPNFMNMEKIKQERCVDRVIGFVPTGWTYDIKKEKFSVRKKGNSEIHLVPYSEHSSYEELRNYVSFLKPKEIIPTVGTNGEGMDGKIVASMRKHFRNLVDETASKRKFLKCFKRKVDTCTAGSSIGCLDVGEDISHDHDNNASSLAKLAPKAAFGRHARKRHQQETYEPHVQMQNNRLQDVNSIDSKGTTNAGKADCKLVTDTQGLGKEQLRSILPEWILDIQIERLFNDANGDLNASMALFFDREATLEEEATRQHKHERVQGNRCSSSKHDSAEESRDSVQSRQLNNEPSFPRVETKVSVSKTSPTIMKQPSRMTTPGRNKKVSKKSKGKGSWSAGKEGSRGMQSSLFTFFKKVETNDIANDGGVQDTSSMGAARDHSGTPADTEPAYQLLEILDGKVSEDHALGLLERAEGNISVALEMHYNGAKEVDKVVYADRTNACHNIKMDTGISNIQDKAGNEKSCLQMPMQSARAPGYTDMDIQNSTIKNKNNGRKETGVVLSLCLVNLPIADYNPIEHACWSKGEPAPFLHLARTFDIVEKESSRLKIVDALCNMFRSLLALSKEDVIPALYLTTNHLAPEYENVDLNIGGSIVSAAIEEATGVSKAKLREMYNTIGDLGDVAQACRHTQSMLMNPLPLSIRHVFSTLILISKESGNGSTSRKKALILRLLRACREKEITYIVRILVQNMRIGVMMKTALTSLAHAVVLQEDHSVSMNLLKPKLQEAAERLVEAYNFVPNLDQLGTILLNGSMKELFLHATAMPGIPIKPMLAKITNGISEALKCFQGKAFTAEYKYDGQRAQIHLLPDGVIKLFARSCEDATSRFPDVVNVMQDMIGQGVHSFILDAEVVGVKRTDRIELLPFQELSTREKAAKAQNIKVDVCVFAFDLMYHNGQPLVTSSLRERRQIMQETFPAIRPGYFEFATKLDISAGASDATDTNTISSLQNFLEESIAASCEGIMLKTLDENSNYLAAKRSDFWLKVKRDYVQGLHDTLDLVPIAAWHGNGRKAGWYSPFLLACYDPENEEYQSVCRVMSGFTDPFYQEMKSFYTGERLLDRQPPHYRTLEKPDVWFREENVWEIRGADFTISPVHQAAVGLVHPSRGISMRFPRFVRKRDDKKPEDASSSSDVAEMFQLQTRKLKTQANTD